MALARPRAGYRLAGGHLRLPVRPADARPRPARRRAPQPVRGEHRHICSDGGPARNAHRVGCRRRPLRRASGHGERARPRRRISASRRQHARCGPAVCRARSRRCRRWLGQRSERTCRHGLVRCPRARAGHGCPADRAAARCRGRGADVASARERSRPARGVAVSGRALCARRRVGCPACHRPATPGDDCQREWRLAVSRVGVVAHPRGECPARRSAVRRLGVHPRLPGRPTALGSPAAGR